LTLARINRINLALMAPRKKAKAAKRTDRDPDLRLLSAYVDKKVLLKVRLEAAKRSMSMSDLLRHLIGQAMENKKLMPPEDQ